MIPQEVTEAHRAVRGDGPYRTQTDQPSKVWFLHEQEPAYPTVFLNSNTANAAPLGRQLIASLYLKPLKGTRGLDTPLTCSGTRGRVAPLISSPALAG